MERRGVTLVETMVAIAIVIVLASIVGLALAYGGRRGNVAACVSNVGQIARALLAYEEDYDGHLPHLPSGNEDDMWHWHDEIRPYLGSATVLICPADDRALRYPEYYRLHPLPTTYSVTASFVRTTNGRGVTSEVLGDGGANPSSQVLICDYMGIDRMQCREDAGGPYHPWYSPHGPMETVLFWDMHVKHRRNPMFTEVAVRIHAEDCKQAGAFPNP